jgi:rubrerythrin
MELANNRNDLDAETTMSQNTRPLDRWLETAGPYETLTLALRMEQGAARGYLAMARAAAGRVARAKFQYLVAEEREHARRLAEARRALPRPAQPVGVPEVAEAAGLPENESLSAALRLAVENERQAERLYRQCAARCRGKIARQLFRSLADQETRHAQWLGEELRLLDGAPAWGSIEGQAPVEQDFWR